MGFPPTSILRNLKLQVKKRVTETLKKDFPLPGGGFCGESNEKEEEVTRNIEWKLCELVVT